MILPDRIIRSLLANGALKVAPMYPDAVQPASIDLHLGTSLMLPDPAEVGGWREVGLYDQPWLKARAFGLAATVERIAVPADVCGMVMGVSSVGRSGLVVETAGLVDPGFAGDLTLELANLTDEDIDLIPGMRIAQLVLWQMAEPAERPYGSDGVGHYQGQSGPTAPWMDREVTRS